MAEASTTELTVTPKQLGKHLRSVRRRKGLSLSEVARGAGLSRRELVAYERGKVPIPESDLWVLAGSCGVDVAELMPTTTTSQELVLARDAATSIGDTVAQLRKHQEDPGIAPVPRHAAQAAGAARGQAHPGEGPRARRHRRPRSAARPRASTRSSRRCCTSPPTRPSACGR